MLRLTAQATGAEREVPTVLPSGRGSGVIAWANSGHKGSLPKGNTDTPPAVELDERSVETEADVDNGLYDELPWLPLPSLLPSWQ